MKFKNQFSLLTMALLLWSVNLMAQEKVDLEMVYKIKSEGINNSQIQDLSFHLTDYLGPRLSGSTNLRNARNWAADRFRDWGLSNVRIDSYGDFGRGWNVKKSYIAMKEPYYAQVIGYPKAWTDGTDGLLDTEVMLLEINTAEDFAKYKGKLKGKVVITPANLNNNPAFEAEAKRLTDQELEDRKTINVGGGGGRYTPEMLAQLRAQRDLDQKLTAFLMEEEVGLRLTGTRGSFGTVFHTRAGSYSKEKVKTVPEMEIASEHHGRIYRLLKNGKSVKIEDTSAVWVK